MQCPNENTPLASSSPQNEHNIRTTLFCSPSRSWECEGAARQEPDVSGNPPTGEATVIADLLRSLINNTHEDQAADNDEYNDVVALDEISGHVSRHHHSDLSAFDDREAVVAACVARRMLGDLDEECKRHDTLLGILEYERGSLLPLITSIPSLQYSHVAAETMGNSISRREHQSIHHRLRPPANLVTAGYFVPEDIVSAVANQQTLQQDVEERIAHSLPAKWRQLTAAVEDLNSARLDLQEEKAIQERILISSGVETPPMAHTTNQLDTLEALCESMAKHAELISQPGYHDPVPTTLLSQIAAANCSSLSLAFFNQFVSRSTTTSGGKNINACDTTDAPPMRRNGAAVHGGHQTVASKGLGPLRVAAVLPQHITQPLRDVPPTYGGSAVLVDSRTSPSKLLAPLRNAPTATAGLHSHCQRHQSQPPPIASAVRLPPRVLLLGTSRFGADKVQHPARFAAMLRSDNNNQEGGTVCHGANSTTSSRKLSPQSVGTGEGQKPPSLAVMTGRNGTEGGVEIGFPNVTLSTLPGDLQTYLSRDADLQATLISLRHIANERSLKEEVDEIVARRLAMALSVEGGADAQSPIAKLLRKGSSFVGKRGLSKRGMTFSSFGSLRRQRSLSKGNVGAKSPLLGASSPRRSLDDVSSMGSANTGIDASNNGMMEGSWGSIRRMGDGGSVRTDGVASSPASSPRVRQSSSDLPVAGDHKKSSNVSVAVEAGVTTTAYAESARKQLRRHLSISLATAPLLASQKRNSDSKSAETNTTCTEGNDCDRASDGTPKRRGPPERILPRKQSTRLLRSNSNDGDAKQVVAPSPAPVVRNNTSPHEVGGGSIHFLSPSAKELSETLQAHISNRKAKEGRGLVGSSSVDGVGSHAHRDGENTDLLEETPQQQQQQQRRSLRGSVLFIEEGEGAEDNAAHHLQEAEVFEDGDEESEEEATSAGLHPAGDSGESGDEEITSSGKPRSETSKWQRKVKRTLKAFQSVRSKRDDNRVYQTVKAMLADDQRRLDEAKGLRLRAIEEANPHLLEQGGRLLGAPRASGGSGGLDDSSSEDDVANEGDDGLLGTSEYYEKALAKKRARRERRRDMRIAHLKEEILLGVDSVGTFEVEDLMGVQLQLERARQEAALEEAEKLRQGSTSAKVKAMLVEREREVKASKDSVAHRGEDAATLTRRRRSSVAWSQGPVGDQHPNVLQETVGGVLGQLRSARPGSKRRVASFRSQPEDGDKLGTRGRSQPAVVVEEGLPGTLTRPSSSRSLTQVKSAAPAAEGPPSSTAEVPSISRQEQMVRDRIEGAIRAKVVREQQLEVERKKQELQMEDSIMDDYLALKRLALLLSDPNTKFQPAREKSRFSHAEVGDAEKMQPSTKRNRPLYPTPTKKFRTTLPFIATPHPERDHHPPSPSHGGDESISGMLALSKISMKKLLEMLREKVGVSPAALQGVLGGPLSPLPPIQRTPSPAAIGSPAPTTQREPSKKFDDGRLIFELTIAMERRRRKQAVQMFLLSAPVGTKMFADTWNKETRRLKRAIARRATGLTPEQAWEAMPDTESDGDGSDADPTQGVVVGNPRRSKQNQPQAGSSSAKQIQRRNKNNRLPRRVEEPPDFYDREQLRINKVSGVVDGFARLIEAQQRHLVRQIKQEGKEERRRMVREQRERRAARAVKRKEARKADIEAKLKILEEKERELQQQAAEPKQRPRGTLTFVRSSRRQSSAMKTPEPSQISPQLANTQKWLSTLPPPSIVASTSRRMSSSPSGRGRGLQSPGTFEGSQTSVSASSSRTPSPTLSTVSMDSFSSSTPPEH